DTLRLSTTRVIVMGKLSLADVASYLGKKEQVVLDYENNVKLPSFEDLWLLCFLYSCSLECLCKPLLNEIAKKNKMAMCLMSYMRHLNRFYYSSRSYPKPEDYKAVWAQACYSIFPREMEYLGEK
ncbi:MAG: helix-turn-helix transcriptional regulator, partial [Alphaproteobacteria bacterium]|nr:helix-turn-helix transcriptional regulator [Alphaproteobacteria bacterium]